MKVEDRLTRARIQIQRKNPFFAYLSLFLKFVEREDVGTCAIDIDGNFYYNTKFLDKLGDNEVEGVVIHEIGHLAFLHLLRLGSREMFVWNIACDCVVNVLATNNGFIMPKNSIIAINNTIELGKGIVLRDVNEKTAEELYDEIWKKLPKKSGQKGQSEEKGESIDKGRLDKHITREISDKEKSEKENEWKNRVEEAYVSSKMKGEVPLGVERLIGKLHESKINWKDMLYRHITQAIPYDFSYRKPNKKSISYGYYVPDVMKEKIEVVVCIDTSGSIGQEELNDFLSEIIGIAKAFRNRLSIRVLCHDIEVHTDYLVENGNIDKIKQVEIKGGGGTSHKPILDLLKNKYGNTKFAVFFTDMESDLQEIKLNDYPFAKLFVVSKQGNEECKLNGQSNTIKLG